MNIFFDLDGTLIDSRLRLYNLFQELVPQSKFSFNEYWQLKRDNINHAKILNQCFNFQDDEIDLFESVWMKLIEGEELLKLDKPFDGVSRYLISLKSKGFNLFLVTARQFKVSVLQQITNFGWLNIFKNVLVTEQKYNKADLIKPYLQLDYESWIVGDTDQDILVGKELHINTVAVLSGFLSENSLMEYFPDKIVNSVVDFIP